MPIRPPEGTRVRSQAGSVYVIVKMPDNRAYPDTHLAIVTDYNYERYLRTGASLPLIGDYYNRGDVTVDPELWR